MHRQLPAERPIDSNGNLLYPIINDIQPMDFDDVIAADIRVTPSSMARMLPEKSSLKTIIDAPLVTQNISDGIDIGDVLKAQADYRSYMGSVLAQGRLKRSALTI